MLIWDTARPIPKYRYIPQLTKLELSTRTSVDRCNADMVVTFFYYNQILKTDASMGLFLAQALVIIRVVNAFLRGANNA